MSIEKLVKNLVIRAGTRGADGRPGETGAVGPRGSQGLQGPKGDAGSKGDKGDTGDKGETGEQGLRGLQGLPGLAGLQGVKGDTGLQGPKGDTGLQGLTGPVGTQGQKGETGSTGPQGIQGPAGQPGSKGDKGDTGNIGPQGPIGITGPQGKEGSQGLKGDQGETGPQGLQGLQGPKGDTGSQGLKGDKGDKGDTGDSAYKEAVNLGFSGTKEEWITSLKGAKGDKGEQGIQGPKGSQGEAGDNGSSFTFKGALNSLEELNNIVMKEIGDMYVINLIGYAWDGMDWIDVGEMRGPKGEKGDTGLQGVQGSVGQTGAPGAKGEKGDKGEQGVAGSNGGKGDKGDKGDTGLQGPIGQTGQQGIQGTQGSTGAQGIPGVKGDSGQSSYELAVSSGQFSGTLAEYLVSLKGDKGDRGDRGEQGVQGIQGIQGSQGPKGDQGEAGKAGQDGAKGDTGSIGSTGPKGDTGSQGLKGDKGDKGEQGVAGVDGDSAYDVATSNGFIGTEEQWLSSLKGEKGEAGIKGDKGDNGDKGDKGDIGLQGDTGPKGEDGIFNGGIIHGDTEFTQGASFNGPTFFQGVSIPYFSSGIIIRGESGIHFEEINYSLGAVMLSDGLTPELRLKPASGDPSYYEVGLLNPDERSTSYGMSLIPLYFSLYGSSPEGMRKEEIRRWENDAGGCSLILNHYNEIIMHNGSNQQTIIGKKYPTDEYGSDTLLDGAIITTGKSYNRGNISAGNDGYIHRGIEKVSFSDSISTDIILFKDANDFFDSINEPGSYVFKIDTLIEDPLGRPNLVIKTFETEDEFIFPTPASYVIKGYSYFVKTAHILPLSTHFLTSLDRCHYMSMENPLRGLNLMSEDTLRKHPIIFSVKYFISESSGSIKISPIEASVMISFAEPLPIPI